MKGAIGAMKSTLYDLKRNSGISPEVQKRRLRRILQEKLTERQRQAVYGVYFERKRIYQVAEEMGITSSAVSRLVARGKRRIGELMEI